MKKWEYMRTRIDLGCFEYEADQFGAEGWELIAILPDILSDKVQAFFKREVP